MAESGLGKQLDIIWEDKIPAIHRRPGTCKLEQSQRSTRAGANGHLAVAAGLVDQCDHVTFHIRVHEDFFHHLRALP